MRSRVTAVVAFAALALIPPAAVPVAGEPARKSATTDRDSPCPRARFRVVVDVGHTATFPGAVSARGVPEFGFNLSLARRIKRALAAAGFDRTVLLITEGRAKPSLYRRVARANGLRADLFLSVHHDSVPEKFLEVWDHDTHQWPFSDRFKGHSIFVSGANHRYADSLRFGRVLGLQLKARGLRYTPHYTRADMGRHRRKLVDADAGVYRYDRLVVLRRTRMPAVLLEAGSIINRDEELQVAAPERQALIAAAATSAVEQFCDARAVRSNARRKRARPPCAERP